ncbi:chemotaxis protein CheW [bacterium]|nr:chemotaxis protein CheW [bacterium]MCI0602052.1 chemotaxis protein CheW [bacterium]
MADSLQFVAFRIGTQQFAVEIHRVTEVISYCEITPIPGAPPFIEGMIDLRGQLVPVLDMRKRLGLAAIHNTMQTRILILRMNRQKIGLIVDEADQVYTIPVEMIQPPPDGADFVIAVAKHQNLLLVILDLERLLSGEEQVNLKAIGGRASVPANR